MSSAGRYAHIFDEGSNITNRQIPSQLVDKQVLGHRTVRTRFPTGAVLCMGRNSWRLFGITVESGMTGGALLGMVFRLYEQPPRA